MGARRILAVGTAVAGLLLLADAWLAPVRRPGAPRPRESPRERRAAYEAAFARPASAADDRVARFRARALEVRGRTTAAIELFDAERMTAAAGVVAPAGEVYLALGRGLGGVAAEWDDARICRVERLPGGRDVVAYVRHGPLPARWWLTDWGDQVRAWDYEDCRVGIRLSELLACGRDPATADSTVAALAALNDPGGDLELALKAADAVPVRVLLRLALAARALRDGEPGKALEHANTAGAERPGMAAVDLVRSAAHARLGHAAEAAAARARYEELFGPVPPE